MVNLFFFFLLIFSLFFTTPSFVRAANTPKAYVTLVNPIRGRSIWKDITLLKSQVQMIVDKKIPATWLVQYEALRDEELLQLLKNLPKTHEIGLFLEVDETLATDALVPYLLNDGGWWRADKVLLSGYKPPERKRMIDTAFETFKKKFGFYPVSIGSWYIDTLSLRYVKQKFGVKIALSVSDQYQTDTYGVWGTAWGTPYFPSTLNSLIPSKERGDRIGIVTIQWAPRDPVLGFGKTTFDSTYSVQANDYIGHHRLSSSYFEVLAKTYLFSQNPLTQLTIGLEGGQEGAIYTYELKNQIEILEKLQIQRDISFVTMQDFAHYFITTYPDSSPNFFIEGRDRKNPLKHAFWFTTPFYRIGLLQDGDNLKLRDLRIYSKQIVFPDIADRDTHTSLVRIIPSCTEERDESKRILIKEIDEITVIRDGEVMRLIVTTKDKKKNVVILETEKMSINNTPFFIIQPKESLSTQMSIFVARFLLFYEFGRSTAPPFGFRFANVNETYYAGVMVASDKLMGIATKPPFFGIFEFPFQVLTRFKTTPYISLSQLFFRYFVPAVSQCTIRL